MGHPTKQIVMGLFGEVPKIFLLDSKRNAQGWSLTLSRPVGPLQQVVTLNNTKPALKLPDLHFFLLPQQHLRRTPRRLGVWSVAKILQIFGRPSSSQLLANFHRADSVERGPFQFQSHPNAACLHMPLQLRQCLCCFASSYCAQALALAAPG